jgi:hypothetical protein
MTETPDVLLAKKNNAAIGIKIQEKLDTIDRHISLLKHEGPRKDLYLRLRKELFAKSKEAEEIDKEIIEKLKTFNLIPLKPVPTEAIPLLVPEKKSTPLSRFEELKKKIDAIIVSHDVNILDTQDKLVSEEKNIQQTIKILDNTKAEIKKNLSDIEQEIEKDKQAKIIESGLNELQKEIGEVTPKSVEQVTEELRRTEELRQDKEYLVKLEEQINLKELEASSMIKSISFKLSELTEDDEIKFGLIVNNIEKVITFSTQTLDTLTKYFIPQIEKLGHIDEHGEEIYELAPIDFDKRFDWEVKIVYVNDIIDSQHILRSVQYVNGVNFIDLYPKVSRILNNFPDFDDPKKMSEKIKEMNELFDNVNFIIDSIYRVLGIFKSAIKYEIPNDKYSEEKELIDTKVSEMKQTKTKGVETKDKKRLSTATKYEKDEYEKLNIKYPDHANNQIFLNDMYADIGKYFDKLLEKFSTP